LNFVQPKIIISFQQQNITSCLSWLRICLRGMSN